MKVLKASAGSGKTYSLTKEYIKLLLSAETPDAYRHILAVTFTNKATDEMKRRILDELYTLSRTPEKSPYVGDLIPETAYDLAELRSKSYRMLTNILHDYSAFAVSTIDRFFQQTLRMFSREIGQFTSYQIELDKDLLVDDAVSRVMDGLSASNPELLDWVVKGVKADLRATGRFSLDRRMKDIAKSIVTEDPKNTQYDWNQLEQLYARCDEIVTGYVSSVRNAAHAIGQALTDSGIATEDTNRGFVKAAFPYEDVSEREYITPPTSSFREKALNPELWFAKSKSWLLSQCSGILDGPLADFVALFGDPYKEYTTAFAIRSQVYTLGLAGELRKAFVEAQKERGVISIEDTNTILHGIIDGTDTPFLYEKLGVRFEDFLLDEFQDTSEIQWENFRPLIQNSEAEGHKNLIVGDVKQSIYRWRGSDWNLLGSQVQKQLRIGDDDITVLDGNYRTCKAIVGFNNEFFRYAAGVIDNQVELDPAAEGSISRIYDDVMQNARTREEAEGSVDVVFVENADKEMAEIVKSICEVVTHGAQYGDIAVLVRGNAEGSEIAARLIDEDIPVISDDSLYVKSAVTVRRLVSQLSLIDNPSRAAENSVEGYMATEMAIGIPSQYHTLVDLAEAVLSELKTATPDLFRSEGAFIQAYMDWLQDWTGKNGNNLGAMLRDWAEAEPKISSPEGLCAVRILTIHKSKGLEFPYVIFPFAEKVTLYKPSTYWCKPEIKGTALDGVAVGRYRASLSDGSMNSCFKQDYIRERYQQAVDNINVFYVALTRAKYGLKIIAAAPPKTFVAAFGKDGGKVSFKNLSQVLYAFVGGADKHVGTDYDFTAIARKTEGPKPIVLDYACSVDAQKRRLVFRTAKKEPVLF